MRTLLKVGFSDSAVDEHGATPLHYAAQSPTGSKCVAAFMSRRGAAYVPDSERRFPLHWAAATGDLDVCMALLAPGKPPRGQIAAGDAHGRTALHAACFSGPNAAAVVKALLEVGPRPWGAAMPPAPTHASTAGGGSDRRPRQHSAHRHILCH